MLDIKGVDGRTRGLGDPPSDPRTPLATGLKSLPMISLLPPLTGFSSCESEGNFW
jgi:hypothetical protein